ncbi:restriction endonuclease subunit S [Raoultella ornithinolytica]|uniref:restriction endonuclease subunit S n=1 Tax=Raoultella ornithinolytica TaxID=54291 RepID=UPI0015DBDD76|nr:restriction endonuclease subunit S [Raoultella ornithinolytica]EJD6653942.1 restriction endonuclease subunit S [Raoultella ornithinolytica]ELV3663727.1 restriction endonuclease subunit S [Raoultella ornithinolytica]BBJ88243.1 type I restriction endonuclease EcoAI subunit S [Raoultella ornithinolytica]BBT87178.1 type I restriction endonuclease EcoAI subunit S [Raoultella ornithinolytica]HDV9414103.1 restriction endonuclease subunit S [Raoultella ornithinolytica]
MAVEKLIVEHIDTWTTALQTRSTAGRGSSGKIDLYGIKKLRELILELAVRGKLVPQDPNDEPASELLKRIAAEKAELVKLGKIKKPKPLPEISEEEKPFELPEGWEWGRLVEIYDVRDGTHDTPKYQSEGYPLVTSKNLSSGKLNFDDIKYIGKEAHHKIKERSFVEFNDILFAMIGSIGNPVIVDTQNEFSIKNVALFKYYSKTLSVPDYLRCVLESLSLVLRNISSGGVQPFVSLSTLRNTVMALPPLAEQYRIIVKLTALMSLCDQLEQHSLTSLDVHQQLVETLLTTLTDSQNADELAENWARISEHFDTLFTTEASIDALKQTILQLAVMGKLVPQDPNDEPASELLNRIAQEKAQLVKDGKIKKQKPLPPISDEEKPFKTPNNWEWVRFGEIGEIKGGGTPSKNNAEFWEGDIPWISPKDMKVDYISKSELTISQEAVQNSSVTLISEGSLLFVVRGMILAHTFPVAIVKKEATINQDMKAISTDLYHPDFLIKMMQACSTRVLSLVDRSSHGTCKLVSDKLFSLVLPLPPLKEQLRISSEVDSFISYCEKLKKNIKVIQQTQLHLADALTDAAIN